MANENNLKVLSPSEAREFGKIGGLASAKSRKEKKDLKERLEIMFDVLKEKQKSKLSNEDYEIINLIGYDLYIIMKALSDDNVSMKIKLNVIEKIWNRLYGKPKDMIQNINFDNDTFIIDGEDFSEI
jgi:hypothetical protein